MPEVELKNVDVALGERLILHNVSFHIDSGVVAVVGRNGSGKSTLLKTIAGLIKPNNGSVVVNGLDVNTLKAKERAKLVGYCWQNPYYGFFEETVEREIFFILKNTGVKGREDLLDDLDVRRLFDRNPFKLSGGEARRVSIASVLVADQPVVLMDEPFNDLDAEGYRQMLKVLKKYRNEGKLIFLSFSNAFMLKVVEPEKIFIVNNGKVFEVEKESSQLNDILAENGILIPGDVDAKT
jgi:energy-coupling factor transport system ATP-binding protein